MHMCQKSSNILNIIEEFSFSGTTYIVTKFACGGELNTYLESLGVYQLAEEHAHHIVCQIA